MPAKRSPNCPAHSLVEAIEKTRLIYAAEGRNSFSGARAVARMGYNGLNGASRRALGAIRGFGLVAGRGVELRISDDAVLVIADADADDQSDRQAALLRCLQHNRVFGDLYERYGQQGSSHEISGYLQKKYHFKPNAADRTAEIFRDSLRMLASRAPIAGADAAAGATEFTAAVAGSPGITSVASGDGAAGVPGVASRVGTGTAMPSVSGIELDGTDPVAVGASDSDLKDTGHRQDSFVLDRGVASLSWPEKMTAEEFEDFTDWLILEHRKIARRIGGALVRLSRHGPGSPKPEKGEGNGARDGGEYSGD